MGTEKVGVVLYDQGVLRAISPNAGVGLPAWLCNLTMPRELQVQMLETGCQPGCGFFGMSYYYVV